VETANQYSRFGPGGLLRAPALHPSGQWQKSPLLKFAPGKFVEPLSVQNLPVETANQYSRFNYILITLQFFIWLGREDYQNLLPYRLATAQ